MVSHKSYALACLKTFQKLLQQIFANALAVQKMKTYVVKIIDEVIFVENPECEFLPFHNLSIGYHIIKYGMCVVSEIKEVTRLFTAP